MHDVSNIWRVPLIMADQDVHKSLVKHLGLPESAAASMDLQHWRSSLAERWDSLKDEVKIAMVGKYTGEQPWTLAALYLSHTRGCRPASSVLLSHRLSPHIIPLLEMPLQACQMLTSLSSRRCSMLA